jgi:hypothetical protein
VLRLLAVLVACGGLSLVASGNLGARNVATRSAASLPGAVGAGLAPAKVGRFELGAGHAWELHATLGMEVERGSSPEPVEISGRFRQLPTDVEGGTVFVRTALEAVRVTFRRLGADSVASGADGAAERLGAALAKPLFARYSAAGELLELFLPGEQPKSVADVLGALVASVQFVAGGDDVSIRTERDLLGTYLAGYEPEGPRLYRKHKVSYVVGPGAGLAQPAATVLSSTGSFELSGSGWPARVTVEDQLRVALGSDEGVAFRTRLSISLGGATTFREPEAVGAFGRGRSALRARALGVLAGDDPSVAEAEARQVLGSETLATLVERLRAHAPRGGATRDPARRATVAKLKALFRLESGALARVPELARSIPEPGAALVISALGVGDVPGAAKALLSVVGDAGVPRSVRRSALYALVRSREVPLEADMRLTSLSQSPADGLELDALVALGSLAFGVRDSDPPRALRLTELAIGEFTRATDPRRKRHALIALGNAGNEAGLDALRRAIVLPDAALAEAGLDALRQIRGAEAEQLLREALRDSTPRKRVAAVGALRQREFGPFVESVIRLAREDTDESVRVAATQALGKRLATFPTLASVLQERASADPSATVRSHARRLLGGGQATPG